jgi:hypothetical protein
MAQLAVAAAGAAVGSLFGAPQVGWLVGSFIGSQLFAEQRRVEGPRLGDLQVQASTYGMGIPQVFGSMRLAGNVIWARPLIEKRRKQSSGKGGGGQTVVSYEYFATFAVAFARGPVDAIRRVWAIWPKARSTAAASGTGSRFTASISAPRTRRPTR